MCVLDLNTLIKCNSGLYLGYRIVSGPKRLVRHAPSQEGAVNAAKCMATRAPPVAKANVCP